MTKCLATAHACHAWFYRLLFFLLALLFINTVSAEAGVAFSWLGNPAQENVTGYRLYYGAQSRFDTSGKLKAGFAYDYYLDFATFKRCVPGGTTASCVNLTSSDYSCTNLSGSAPQCTINNLQGLLHFTLTAYNTTSESGYTSELSKTVEVVVQPLPDTTAPVITSGPTVNSITGTSANIKWSTNEQASTVLRYGLTSGNLNRVVSISTYQTARQRTLTGLQPGTRYYFRVKSTDPSGNTGYSNVANFTTKAAAPVIISGPTVNSITGTSANIQWSTNKQASTVLRYGLTSSNLNRAVSISRYETAHQRTLYSLQPGTRYYFRIESTDLSGNKGYGTVANFTTKAAAPVIISGPTVNSITGTSANIQWSTNKQASTVLRYGLTSSNLNRAVSISRYETAHQRTLYSLQPGTRYYFRIESTDLSGNKGYGTVANFTTKAAATSAALLVTVSDGDAIIDVNDNSPAAFNPDQTDKNGNGRGDVSEKFNWNLFLPIIMKNNRN